MATVHELSRTDARRIALRAQLLTKVERPRGDRLSHGPTVDPVADIAER